MVSTRTLKVCVWYLATLAADPLNCEMGPPRIKLIYAVHPTDRSGGFLGQINISVMCLKPWGVLFLQQCLGTLGGTCQCNIPMKAKTQQNLGTAYMI